MIHALTLNYILASSHEEEGLLKISLYVFLKICFIYINISAYLTFDNESRDFRNKYFLCRDPHLLPHRARSTSKQDFVHVCCKTFSEVLQGFLPLLWSDPNLCNRLLIVCRLPLHLSVWVGSFMPSSSPPSAPLPAICRPHSERKHPRRLQAVRRNDREEHRLLGRDDHDARLIWKTWNSTRGRRKKGWFLLGFVLQSICA